MQARAPAGRLVGAKPCRQRGDQPLDRFRHRPWLRRRRRSQAWHRRAGRLDAIGCLRLGGRRPAGDRRRLLAVDHDARDDLAHDLGGAGHDGAGARVAEAAGERVLLHETVAAEALQALVRRSLRELGSEELGHRALAHRTLAALEQPGGVVDELPRALELGGEVGEPVGERLVVRQRAPERRSLLEVRDGLLEAEVAGADRDRGTGKALELERLHEVVEAHALATD